MLHYKPLFLKGLCHKILLFFRILRLHFQASSGQSQWARYPEAHNNVGTILRELGQFQEASDSFRAALSINPDSADLYNNLGLTLQELGRLSEATDQYTKALAIHPDHPEANYNLGNTLRQLQRLDEAIECLVRAESSTSNQKTSAVLLECYYIKQDPIGFSRQLKKISKMQGFNFRAASISAFVSHQLGTNNLYEFCKHPIDLVTIYDLLDSGEISSDLITQIETMIKNNSNNEVLAPGHISLGFKSTGNLFDEPSPIVNIVYVEAASPRLISCVTVPIMIPPMMLMKTISKPAIASPRTNFAAPSIAPKNVLS